MIIEKFMSMFTINES